MLGVKQRSNEGDPRVATALTDLEFNYEVDADGDFRFGVNLHGDRSQLGFIKSATYTFAGEEMREVYSVGLKSFGQFDARTANFLLDINGKVQIGAWTTVRDKEDNHLAIFSASISADLAGELLLEVIKAVVKTADAIEERLSGRDDF